MNDRARTEKDVTDDGELTVGQAARLVGVSVRTLHHWDEIGLVSPSTRSHAGYRLYGSDDVARIHQVLVYRETGMGLSDIAVVLADPSTQAEGHFLRQRELLTRRIDHLTRMVRAVDTMMEKTMTGQTLTAQHHAEILGRDWDPAWEEEAERRWGDTDDWKVATRRMASQSKEDLAAAKVRIEQVEERLAQAMREDVEPGSERANALAEEHRASLSWFDVTRSKHVLIACNYVDDPRFAAHYDEREPGLARWLKDVIDANAAAHGIDPATAQWE